MIKQYLPALPVFAFLLASSIACKKQTDGLVQLDLLPHGMPIVIHAPENPAIRKMDFAIMRDLTVVKGPDFNVQIFEADLMTRNTEEIRNRLLNDVKANRYFSKVLQEDAAGFVYETQVDSNYINYGFRHIRLQGDKEYVFQQGLGGRFSLEAVQRMYKAVQ